MHDDTPQRATKALTLNDLVAAADESCMGPDVPVHSAARVI
jgi:hypothetical protein